MSQVDHANETRMGGGNHQGGALPFSLQLELAVQDPEVIAELMPYEEGPARDDFALAALRIGVLSLRQARGQVDGETIRHESDRLLVSLERQLGEHARAVHGRVTECLKEYFDPQSGRFQERVTRLIQKDGELELLLRRQVGGEDSQLSQTLIEHVGKNSPLMQWLGPDESKGLLSAMQQTLADQLRQQREHVLNQFSLDNKEGALCRLVQELTEYQGKVSGQLQERIDAVVKEFSLDREDSALSRLVRNVDRAQRTITAEFSLDNEQSALSRLQQMLEATNQTIHNQLTLDDDRSPLARLKRELLELLDRQGKASRDFQENVTKTLGQLAARREEAARSTRHGLVFEDAVYEFVSRSAQRSGDVAENTSRTPGLISHCKIGDAVIRLGPDSATPGAAIVVESKEEQGRHLNGAREEIEKARKNRGAQVGLFVFSAKAAPQDLEPIGNYGNDIFVVWNAEDESTDIYLRSALLMARTLCVRQGRQQRGESADFKAMTKAVLAIEKQAKSLDEIMTSTKTIGNANDKIRKRAEICRKELEAQVERLQRAAAALKESFDANEEGL